MSSDNLPQGAAAATYESIRDLARAENWPNRKIKEALFQAGLSDRKSELLAELGREAGQQVAAPAVDVAALTAAIGPAIVAVAEKGAYGFSKSHRKAIILDAGFEVTDISCRVFEELAAAALGAETEIRNQKLARERKEQEEKALVEKVRLAALRLADGDVIWCDSAENTVVRVVNSYGRQKKFDNGGYRVGLKCGEIERVFFNSQCPDQFAGECYSVLKSVELAAEHGCKSVTIRNDRIGGFEATTKRGYIGAKYLWVAKKIAIERGVTVNFNLCSSAENLADAVARQGV
jgi:hypothetical protein